LTDKLRLKSDGRGPSAEGACESDGARFDRRHLARLLGAGALGTATLGSNAAAWALAAQTRAVKIPPAYLADFDNDGKVSRRDERTLSAAVGSRRGFGLVPAEGYDSRADFFARLRVGEAELDSIRALRQLDEPIGQQPVTVAWHYGWYGSKNRPTATAGYLGGPYRSSDPAVEGEFNRLKNEFGINVDALSWINRRVSPRNVRAYKKGYLKAPLLGTRHTCLLYESSINLGEDGGAQLSFLPEATRNALIIDFDEMAHFLTRARDRSPARIFEIGGRPVIFLYASHTWGHPDRMPEELRIIDDVLAVARDRFANIYGAPPYLVGEEMILSDDDEFGIDRASRSRNFDGLFVYHHVTTPDRKYGDFLDAEYARGSQGLLRRTLNALELRTNRFTGAPLRVFPSLAAGFAKKGSPRLWVSRQGYRDFLREMDQYCRKTGFGGTSDGGLDLFPIYTIGSWNEEAEGHALFPAKFNRSLKSLRYGGFDLALGLKETFGWNTYANKRIDLGF